MLRAPSYLHSSIQNFLLKPSGRRENVLEGGAKFGPGRGGAGKKCARVAIFIESALALYAMFDKLLNVITNAWHLCRVPYSLAVQLTPALPATRRLRCACAILDPQSLNRTN